MSIEVFFSGEALPTISAFERSVLFVHISSMHLKSGLSVEYFAAELAFESVLTGVVEEVCFETTSLYELLPTIRAFVWTDSRVDSHMSVECALQ